MVAVRGKVANGTTVERNGTGFVVGTSRNVVTANHVVATPPEGWAKTDFGLADVTVVIRFRDQQTGLLTEIRRASVQKSVPDKDSALLEFEGLPRRGLSTCPAAEADKVGTQLNVAGILNSEGTDVPRLELNVGVLNEGQPEDGKLRRLSAQTRSGFSGGPVFLVENQDNWRLVGVLKGGQSVGISSESFFTPASELRNFVLGACAVACRDPSHGVERYDRDMLGPRTESDWLRGGSTSEGFCGSLRSSEMNSHPGEDISIENHGNVDQRFFTGWRDGSYIVRESQYKFYCQLRYRSGPTFKLALTDKCPLPPNPEKLPN
nr:serine protease [Bradyrhizobium sp. Oc8]